MTFGLKMLLWSAEIERDIDRVEHAKKTVSVCKLSGAGRHDEYRSEDRADGRQDAGPSAGAPCHAGHQRDRHAEFVGHQQPPYRVRWKRSRIVRNLQRTDIREAEEYFSLGQKGSSGDAAQAQSDQLRAHFRHGAALNCGNAVAAMEDVTLWHERDISHSSGSQVILLDTTINLDYCTKKLTDIIDKLLKLNGQDASRYGAHVAA